MSKLEVDAVEPQSGTSLTLGASGDTITIPAGATLANNGTATGFGSIAWQAVTTAATLTTIAGKGYPINTTSNACTVTLPSSASVGDQVQIVDYAGTFATNNITLTSSLKIEGATLDKLLTTNREGVTITYADATQGWVASSGVNSGDQALDPLPPYSVDFLVVAGGGCGGQTNSGGGGGGAGGYRTSTQTVNSGTAITATVGDGSSVNSTNGSNSSISGSGLTTITSAGGGGGGNEANAGKSGGSGGGGTESTGTPAARSGGAGNTPSTSPSQGSNGGTCPTGGGYNGSGGGGASQTGFASTGVSGNGGNGGNGTASSITGSSVTYAGGGGGATYNGTLGTGGSGGGGNGQDELDSIPATAGAVNTGGGGGGRRTGAGSGSGGKGVVILSMPDASYTGITTGSPTVATGVSGKTILTFTGSGSYTG